MIRTALSAVARAAIKRALPLLPEPRVILDREGKRPYLSRYYLTSRPRMADGSAPVVGGELRRDVLPPPPVALYLHRFHQSDDGGQLHNHPWRWALSLVLAGGYSEERRGFGGRVDRRTVSPFSLNWIGRADFHRVDLLEEDAWTLFLVGPKVSSWSFWERVTGETIPWRDYITRIRGEGWDES